MFEEGVYVVLETKVYMNATVAQPFLSLSLRVGVLKRDLESTVANCKLEKEEGKVKRWYADPST